MPSRPRIGTVGHWIRRFRRASLCDSHGVGNASGAGQYQASRVRRVRREPPTPRRCDCSHWRLMYLDIVHGSSPGRTRQPLAHSWECRARGRRQTHWRESRYTPRAKQWSVPYRNGKRQNEGSRRLSRFDACRKARRGW